MLDRGAFVTSKGHQADPPIRYALSVAFLIAYSCAARQLDQSMRLLRLLAKMSL